MAWIKITNTNWEYDNDAFNNLPDNRKDFWNRQSDVSINLGIKTMGNGTEIYLNVRKVGDNIPVYHENELNKTYLDNK